MLSEIEAPLVQQTLQPSQHAQSLPVTSSCIFSLSSGILSAVHFTAMTFAVEIMPESPETAVANASSLSGKSPAMTGFSSCPKALKYSHALHSAKAAENTTRLSATANTISSVSGLPINATVRFITAVAQAATTAVIRHPFLLLFLTKSLTPKQITAIIKRYLHIDGIDIKYPIPIINPM